MREGVEDEQWRAALASSSLRLRRQLEAGEGPARHPAPGCAALAAVPVAATVAAPTAPLALATTAALCTPHAAAALAAERGTATPSAAAADDPAWARPRASSAVARLERLLLAEAGRPPAAKAKRPTPSSATSAPAPASSPPTYLERLRQTAEAHRQSRGGAAMVAGGSRWHGGATGSGSRRGACASAVAGC